VDEVDGNDKDGKDGEADCQRYADIHPNVDAFVRLYTYTHRTRED